MHHYSDKARPSWMSSKIVRRANFLLLAWFGLTPHAWTTPDLKFDVMTFCCPCSVDSHICQAQFDELNFPTINGHYIAMGTDAHRLDLATNGKALAIQIRRAHVSTPV